MCRTRRRRHAVRAGSGLRRWHGALAVPVWLLSLAQPGCTWLFPLDDYFCPQGVGCDGGAPPADTAVGGQDGGPSDAVPGGNGLCPGTCPAGACDGPLQLHYASNDQEPEKSSIRAEFRILNTAAEAVPLSELQIRYYFTLETGIAPGFDCNFVRSSLPPYECDNLDGDVGPLVPPLPGADHVLTIRFSEAAGTLEGYRDTRGFKVAIMRDMGNGDFNQSNDWSFDGQNTALHSWPCITLHRGDDIVFGTPPDARR